MSLLFKAPYTRQPQTPAGLVRPITAGISGFNGNLGSIPLRPSSGAKQVVTPYGIGFNSGYFERPGVVFPDSNNFGNSLAACRTINISFVVTSASVLQAIASEGVVPTSGAPKWLLQNNLGALRLYNSSAYQALGNAILGKLHTVTLRYNDFSPYTLDVFLDGVLKATTTSYRLASYAYPGTGYPSGLVDGAILLYTGTSGVIPSNAEIAAYAANPWQIFKPQSRTLWLPGTVSAGGTTDALTSQPISIGSPTLTQAALGQTHALTSQAIATAAATITQPALVSVAGTDTLTAQPISTSAATVMQAALGQIHALTSQATDTAAATITQPAIGQIHALTLQAISTSAATVMQAALGQIHALTSQATDTAAPILTQVAIGQIHALTSQAFATAAPTITTPALTAASNVDTLIAQAISAGQITITQATLAQIHVLTSQAIATSAPTISQPTLTAAANFDNLTAQHITTGSPTISTPGIGQIHVLTGLAVSTGAPTLSLPIAGVLGGIYWPLPAEVKFGVQYGPASEFTGTLTGGTGPTAAEIAAEVWQVQTISMSSNGSVGKWVTGKLLTVPKFLGLR